jgi:DNA-binding response OmpR family regulator
MTGGSMPPSAGNGKRILVVEDTEPIANALAMLLGKYGAVDITYNGQEALMQVALHYYDAIVSDIHMPFMNGIEFYKAAIEIDSTIKNRFMFLTSSFSEEHLNFFINNNLPYLFKPARAEEVESLIEEILSGTYVGWSEIEN